MASHFADAETFAKQYAEFSGNKDPAEAERMRHETLEGLSEGRIRLSNPKEAAIDLMLRAVRDSSQLVYQMQWFMLVAGEPTFVTSDRGMAVYDPTPTYPWSAATLLSSPNSQTSIPLDPHHCLLMRPPKADGPSEEAVAVSVDGKRALEINLRTYGWTTDYVFAHSQQLAADLHQAAKRAPHKLVRPGRIRSVMLIDAEPGDDRLADEHRRRGWPARLEYEGLPHDYVVLDDDARPVERAVDLSILAKERAVRRLGTEDLEASTLPVDPSHLAG